LSENDDLAPIGGEPDFIFSYNFASGLGEWQIGFVEYPLSAEDTMNIDVALVAAPPELGAGDSLLRLSAIDPVGDLFSFIKIKITGLSANTELVALVETEFAAVNFDSLGTTYDGDQEVHVKAGIFELEPLSKASSDTISLGYAFNTVDIQKGNGDEIGSDVVSLGSLIMPAPQVFTSLLRGNNNGAELRGKTDANGNLWLLIGMDSETQMHQAFYFSRVSVLFDEVE